MLIAKISFAAATGFLAGVFASPLFFEQPTSQQNLPPLSQHGVVDVADGSRESHLLAAIESMEAMLIEQNIRLESAERGIYDLIDANHDASHDADQAVSASVAKKVDRVELEQAKSHSSEELQQDTAHYQYVSAYVDSQLQNGAWSRDNAHYLMLQTAKLPQSSRAEIQLKVVQAINEGRLQIEDPSVPIF